MQLDWFRDLCLSFPGATETMQWNSLVFKVGGKMFAVVPLEPAERILSFKCSPENFNELSETPGCVPAPYLARAQWIALESDHNLRSSQVADLLKDAYGQIYAKLPKKVKLQIEQTLPPKQAS
jgi:predicted DNA-binding protein (MmcQ/YjbR family)